MESGIWNAYSRAMTVTTFGAAAAGAVSSFSAPRQPRPSEQAKANAMLALVRSLMLPPISRQAFWCRYGRLLTCETRGHEGRTARGTTDTVHPLLGSP